VSAGHGEQPLIQSGVQDERLRTEAADLFEVEKSPTRQSRCVGITSDG